MEQLKDKSPISGRKRHLSTTSLTDIPSRLNCWNFVHSPLTAELSNKMICQVSSFALRDQTVERSKGDRHNQRDLGVRPHAECPSLSRGNIGRTDQDVPEPKCCRYGYYYPSSIEPPPNSEIVCDQED